MGKEAVQMDGMHSLVQSKRRELVHDYFNRVKDSGIEGEDRFARLTKSVILALRKKPGAYSLYSLLMTYVPFSNSSSECWPKVSTLAKELGVSQSTVRRDLKHLKNEGLVEVEKKHGKNYYTLYTIPLPSSTSATDNGQICAEDQSDLHAGEGVIQGVSAVPDRNPGRGSLLEREQGSRPIEKELLAEARTDSVGILKSSQLSQDRARQPLESYLESGRGQQLARLRTRLSSTSEPVTLAEQRQEAQDIVELCLADRDLALDLLEEFRAGQQREAAMLGDTIEGSTALRIDDRAKLLEYYIRQIRTPDEIRESEAILEEASRFRESLISAPKEVDEISARRADAVVSSPVS